MVWLTGWSRRKFKAVNGTTTSQIDYQMKITIHKGVGSDGPYDILLGGHCRDDFGDVRFTSSDQTTLLGYWIESYISGNYAIFWIKIPSIPISPNTTTIYIYYDNPVESSVSNGTNTFDFFDDFDGSTIDVTKWTVTGTITVSGGTATFGTNGVIKSIASFSNANTILEADHNFGSGEWFGWVNAENVPKGLFYRAGVNNLIINHEGNFASNISGVRSNKKIATSTTQQRFYENNIELTGSPRTIANVSILYIRFNSPSQILYQVRVRKYASPEPTFGTSSNEELNITAINFTLDKDTCLQPCSIAAGVTWQSFSNSDITFRPAVLIDGTTLAYAAIDITISAGGTGSSLITIPTLSEGYHTICPYPN